MRPALITAALLALLAAAAALAQGAGPVKVPAVPAQASPPAAAQNPAEDAIAPSSLDAEEARKMLVEGEVLYKHVADRDPFSPLVSAKATKGGDVKTKFGTAGVSRFTVESCNLTAIVKIQKSEVAWFAGPDNKPYKVTIGEMFADGKVTSISYELGRVVVQQELINDQTHVKPFRDLVLVVRSQGGESK